MPSVFVPPTYQVLTRIQTQQNDRIRQRTLLQNFQVRHDSLQRTIVHPHKDIKVTLDVLQYSSVGTEDLVVWFMQFWKMRCVSRVWLNNNAEHCSFSVCRRLASRACRIMTDSSENSLLSSLITHLQHQRGIRHRLHSTPTRQECGYETDLPEWHRVPIWTNCRWHNSNHSWLCRV